MRRPPRDAREEELLRDLRVELSSLSLRAFLVCVGRLLSAMGYRDVRLLERRSWRQRTGHGGYDLTARAVSGIHASPLLVQAKQYHRPVARHFVDELKGAMLRERAGQGLLVTLSDFAPKAAAAADAEPLLLVRLVDGAELAGLLLRHGIGIRSRPGRRPAVDKRFFRRLRKRHPGRPGSLPSGASHREAAAGRAATVAARVEVTLYIDDSSAAAPCAGGGRKEDHAG